MFRGFTSGIQQRDLISFCASVSSLIPAAALQANLPTADTHHSNTNSIHPSSSAAATQRRALCSMPTGVNAQQQQDKQAYDKQWHDTWQQGLEPGQMFDAGCCSPLLKHLLSSGQLSVKGKKTFVPGCGRGYDVFAFAAAGAAVSAGLDLSPEAIAAARATQQTELAANPTASAAVHLSAGDFFSHSFSADVGYDYTFLCALHPDMRQDWARAWSDLIAPGGELVTLIFPVGLPDWVPNRNPPWEVTPELYQGLLLPAGFEQVVLEPVPEHLSHKPRAGREWLGRWRRVAGSSDAAIAGGQQKQQQPATTSHL